MRRFRVVVLLIAVLALLAVSPLTGAQSTGEGDPVLTTYPLPSGAAPHDVAPSEDGIVWYTAQHSGNLGRFDVETGEARHIPLGAGSRPHGVIIGPDGAPWITDGGLNAIVRVDPETEEVAVYPLPSGGNANLNTAAFDGNGVLWFTGQNGIYGRFDPETEEMQVFNAPRGRGPYGIAATPDGEIYYASLAGSYIGHIDLETGEVTVIDPPTPNQGARRIWSDSNGVLWISEWNAGQLGRYDPEDESWQEWPLPGDNPRPYAVYVDDRDDIWLSDFAANALVRFDPDTETFETFTLENSGASVRQLLGIPGEVWAPESSTDHLTRVELPELPEEEEE